VIPIYLLTVRTGIAITNWALTRLMFFENFQEHWEWRSKFIADAHSIIEVFAEIEKDGPGRTTGTQI
jgi:hypothetical protein